MILASKFQHSCNRGPDHYRSITHLVFLISLPESNSWNKETANPNGKGNFIQNYVGRLGDTTTFQSLPAVLRREDIAIEFGASTDSVVAAGSVMVCGSPGEVASRHDEDSGPRVLGGFDMFTEYNQTSSSTRLREQRRAIWMHIAMHAPDQLRQRVAHALSQILVVSPGAIGKVFKSRRGGGMSFHSQI
jgi:hypothetical protein